MGRNHRRLFHDPISAPLIGSVAALCSGKDPIGGAAAALVHTGQDSLDTALGGAKVRRQFRMLKGMGPLLLVLLVMLFPVALVVLLVVAARRWGEAATDAPLGTAPPPPPPSELEMFARAKHREGVPRRDIAMQLIMKGCTSRQARDLLSFMPGGERGHTSG